MCIRLQYQAAERTRGNADHQPGFTLVELLVVIAIIALLASLLLPALSRGKSLAKRTVCQSNLRQLALAFNFYAQEFDCYPPLALFRWGNPLSGAGPTGVSLWNAFILPYVSSNRALFNCPAFPVHYQWTLEPSGNGYNFPTNIQGNRPFSYGANVMGVASAGPLGLADGQGGVGRKSSDFKNPSDMISLGDDVAQNQQPNPGSNKVGIWGMLHAFSAIGRVDGMNHISQVHNSGANMVFLDGHTEWDKGSNWIEPDDAATRRWNFDNQPHPEFWKQ